MELDAWQLSVYHKYNLDNLTTLAQMEILSALEPYKNRPVNELLQFLSRDLLKILSPFQELGRQLSVSHFEDQHALAAAKDYTPVEPLAAIVVTALNDDSLNKRNKTSSLVQALREETNPALRLFIPETVVDELLVDAKVETFDPSGVSIKDTPQPVKVAQPAKPKQAAVKEKMKALTAEIKADIKADRLPDFDKIQEKVAEATQAQVFEDDRDNLSYYADLEKTIKSVKRIPSSGGCAWCKRSAEWADGDSGSHKFCKCTTGYIYEGEDDDKFLDDEQKKFRDDYEAAKQRIKNGETEGRLLKVGTPEREKVMGREIRDAAFKDIDAINKAESEKLGRPLLKKEEKAIAKSVKADSNALAKKLNSGEKLTLEDKQKLKSFGLTVEQMRAPKYGTTLDDENVLAVMKREHGYH
jgi:hypothetical protein